MQDLNKNLLRHHQREDLKHEIEQADEMLKHAKPDERGVILAGRDRTKRQLESQSPQPLTPKEKDTLHALEKKLRSKIVENMPTQEVMRKNPPGAVDWHMKWEKQKKKLIRMWKNVTIQLNPDNSDRDLSNIERFRPVGQLDHMRGDAQIPGYISFGNIPDEDWPFEAPQTTALAQVKKHYAEAEAETEVNQALEDLDGVEAEDLEKDEEKVSTLSPEQRIALNQRLAKGREVLRQKREAAKQLNETLEAAPVEVTTT